MIPLFQRFPRLAEALPYVALGSLPTPVESWTRLGAEVDCGALYVKRDDLSGATYGGNKVRKLEFLLGAARACQASAVLTFGAAGSNHALATAIYARELGLPAISMLVPQENAQSVRRNLLRGFASGARLHHFLGRKWVARGTMEEVVTLRRELGRRPYIIPAGGSAPLGVAGFVNAALELADQIAGGELPLPDCLYVASGTMGTCVGLLIGLQLANLATKIVAVRVTSPPFTSMARARRLYGRTVGLLRKADPDFPRLAFPASQFELRDEFLGPGYGRYTEASAAAVERVKDTEGGYLEGTYTGKAMACLWADGEARRLEGRVVLFWNTYNSRSLDRAIASVAYSQLPEAFHRYFLEPVQPLDRSGQAAGGG